MRKVPINNIVTPVQARKKVSTKKQMQTPTTQSDKPCISINRITPSSNKQK